MYSGLLPAWRPATGGHKVSTPRGSGLDSVYGGHLPTRALLGEGGPGAPAMGSPSARPAPGACPFFRSGWPSLPAALAPPSHLPASHSRHLGQVWATRQPTVQPCLGSAPPRGGKRSHSPSLARPKSGCWPGLERAGDPSPANCASGDPPSAFRELTRLTSRKRKGGPVMGPAEPGVWGSDSALPPKTGSPHGAPALPPRGPQRCLSRPPRHPPPALSHPDRKALRAVPRVRVGMHGGAPPTCQPHFLPLVRRARCSCPPPLLTGEAPGSGGGACCDERLHRGALLHPPFDVPPPFHPAPPT